MSDENTSPATNDHNFLFSAPAVTRSNCDPLTDRIPAEKSVLLLDTVLGCSSRSHAVGPSSPVIRGVDWRFGLIRKRSERMEPGILLRIDTTAGPVVLRVGLTVFHKLRFSVAEAFSQLTNLRDKVHGN